MAEAQKTLTSALDGKGNPIPNWFVDTRTSKPYLIFRQKISGHAFKISTGETDFAAAKSIANKEIKEFFKKTPEQIRAEKDKKIRKLNADLMPEFLEKLKANYKSEIIAKGTWTAYHAAHNRVYIFYREFFPEDQTVALWDSFQDWAESTYAGQVQSNLVKYYNKYQSFLIEAGIITARIKITNKFKDREKKKLKAKKSRIFTREEIVRLRKATPLESRLMFDLGYEMAFRISDCVRLTWDRCDLRERHSEFKKAKPDLSKVLPVIRFSFGTDKATTRDLSVPISDNVYKGLARLKKEQAGESKWVFPQARDKTKPLKPQQFDWPKVRKDSAVTYGTYHTLRHTRLTLDFKNANYTATQVMLVRRVSYEVALEHYIHVSDSDLRLLRNPRNDDLS